MGVFRVLVDRIKKKDSVTIAREAGVKIGDRCRILSNAYSWYGSEPYLIEIGNHVEITNGCRFVTHDGAAWVLREFEGLEKIDKFGKITVGNNVFIGLNTTILPGVTIGDNCVIGACSLVNKDVPSGEVWAGVPAKRICSLEEYKDKNMSSFDYTKGLSAKEKEQAVRKAHPEWFN